MKAHFLCRLASSIHFYREVDTGLILLFSKKFLLVICIFTEVGTTIISHYTIKFLSDLFTSNVDVRTKVLVAPTGSIVCSDENGKPLPSV